MKIKFISIVSVAFIGVLVWVGSIYAADERLPANNRIMILFKTLTYDLQLTERCPNGLVIGVVSMNDDKESQDIAKDTINQMKTHLDKKVKGLSLSIEPIEATGIDEVKDAVGKKGINILYLSSGVDRILGSLVELAKAKKILVLTGESAYLSKGAAIGAVMRENKPKILVHLESATAQGAKFDARLLRLVEVIR